MAVIATLAGVAITQAEQQTVAAADVNGSAFADATGLVNSLLVQLKEIQIQLNNLVAAMPAGTNKTNLTTVSTNLS